MVLELMVVAELVVVLVMMSLELQLTLEGAACEDETEPWLAIDAPAR